MGAGGSERMEHSLVRERVVGGEENKKREGAKKGKRTNRWCAVQGVGVGVTVALSRHGDRRLGIGNVIQWLNLKRRSVNLHR